MRSFAVLAVAIAALTLLPSVGAHATAAESDPAFGARLDEAPSEIWIRFTETIDPAATKLTLVDAGGNETPLEDLEVAPDRLSVVVALPEGLKEGGYGVKWEVLSTTDGHRTFGTIPFTIGADAQAIQGIANQAQALRLDAILGKTFAFVGLALMAGTFAFWYLVLPRGQRKGHEEPMERLATVAGWMHMLGIAVFAYSQWDISGLAASDYFFGTEFGQGLNQRLVLGLIALFGLTYAVKREDTPRYVWAGTALVIVLLHIVYGNFSHTAGFVRPKSIGVAADALHLLAIGVWAGGLVAFVVFLFNLPRDREELAEHLRQVPARFSNTALGSVIVAATTGTFMLWAVVGFDLSTWADSVYGKALIGKIALAVLMMAMGAWNKLHYVYRYLKRGGIQTVRAFKDNVKREVYVAAVVFLLAGVLTNTSPPFSGGPDAPEAQVPDVGQDRLVLAAESDTYNWTVTFHPPPEVGAETHFIVDLLVKDLQVRDTNASRVWLVIENTDQPDLGQTPVEANKTSRGTYEAFGAYFPFAGNYNVTVNARSNEYRVFQESVTFEFEL